jgi:hypothetical protein
LRLQQAAERKAVILFLVAVLVSVGTELATTRESFEQGQLLSAVQATHMRVIGSLPGNR